ncbi:MAG: HupE/UreJ family protein [Planctomycetota bacterium]|nr:HupE/UreJ family protein [Planctomycetota bacterium]
MPCFAAAVRRFAAARWVWAAALLLALVSPAQAHKTSVTAVRAELAQDRLTLTLDLHQADLLHAVLREGSDRHAFRDAQELLDAADAVLAHVRENVHVALDGQPLTPAPVRGWPAERPELQTTGPGGLSEPTTLPLTFVYALPAHSDTAEARGAANPRLQIGFTLYGGTELSPIFDLQLRRVGTPPTPPATNGEQTAARPEPSHFLARGESRSFDLAPPAAVAAAPAPPDEGFLPTLFRFGALGMRHILPDGLDHILFVLGLYLLSPKLRPLLLQVTAFTLAHSLTLALSVLGIFSLPSSVIEPLIALSIAVIALENLATRRVRPWRWAVVFVFGLVHGLGFAGGLQEAGLPPGRLLPALLGFNLGVEAGQLSVILIAAAVTFGVSRKEWYPRYVAAPASLLIAGVGLFWTVQRIWFGG